MSIVAAHAVPTIYNGWISSKQQVSMHSEGYAYSTEDSVLSRYYLTDALLVVPSRYYLNALQSLLRCFSQVLCNGYIRYTGCTR